jgi:hypothetical protein
VIRANGQRKAGWPVAIQGSFSGRTPSPALADMNNDGFVDVVFAGTDGALHVFNRNGTPLAPVNNVRYSVYTSGASECSPVVADINGDGLNDVVIGDYNQSLAGISGTGATLPGFPITIGAELNGTPALCDCDGDGMTEIVAIGADATIHMWDYDYPFSPTIPLAWPQFHHDARRTGLMTNRPFVGVPDPTPPRLPAVVELSPASPNPASATSRIWYAVPADRAGALFELALYDLSGREVQVLERGAARPGRYSAEWNLRDRSGQRAGAGVYFVRLQLGDERRVQKLVVLR